MNYNNLKISIERVENILFETYKTKGKTSALTREIKYAFGNTRNTRLHNWIFCRIWSIETKYFTKDLMQLF